MTKKIVSIGESREPKNQNNLCQLMGSCPFGQHAPEDVPVAAIYSMITADGKVIKGATNVKPAHVRVFLEELEALVIHLHQYYNESIQQEIISRTGTPFVSTIPEQ